MNKRFYLLLVMALLLCVSSMKAVPAHPGAVKIQQPDGSYVTLRLLGDEWRHFQTTLDGYSVVKDARGFYVYAEKKDGQLQPTAQVAHDEAERSVSEQAFLADVKKYLTPEMSEQIAAQYQMVQQRQQETLARHRAQGHRATDYSKFKGLIILVEFKDKSFSREDYKDIITDMVNKENYTGYENEKFTGSVRDYFSDNSDAKFQPHFDVVGPYKVEYSQYDCNLKTGKCADILRAAIDSADVRGNVNFKDYDGDGDGTVDLVFYMIAGMGANYNGNNGDLWWPYRSALYARKDGVMLWDYASAVELSGWEDQPNTIKINGIGTICHEFSHVLGLPDFYDTDYEESGGESVHPGIWSLMAGGSYENDARTPVGYSLFERYSVHFCDAPPKITGEGSFTLDPLYSSFTGYRIDSPVNDEFFLFENRQKDAFKWDKYLPGSGMLVHRVEKPGNNLWGGRNNLNVDPEHNLYEVVRAGGKSRPNTAADVFPGSKKVRTLNSTTSPANLKSWSGKETNWGLANITMQNGIITFDVEDAYVLRELILPESLSIGLGLNTQLQVVPIPEYAHYQLTWSSSDDTVATVDQEGNVMGVSVGTCDITVESDNGVKAVCKLTVEEIPVASMSDLKTAEEGTDLMLQLNNAQVLYVYEKTVYLRDESGAIMLDNVNLGLKQGDVISGVVYVKAGLNNNMPQGVGVNGVTDAANLEITGSSAPEPREVKFEDLTEADYADYVLVKQVQLVKDNGVWAVSDDLRARLWNKFQDSSIKLKNYDGKYFDVYAIYGTDLLNNQVINELYMVKSPVEVDAPSAITTITIDDNADTPLYNLQGQRVDATHRGLVIRKGRAVLNK